MATLKQYLLKLTTGDVARSAGSDLQTEALVTESSTGAGGTSAGLPALETEEWFTHWCVPDAATSRLAEALSYTPEVIDAAARQGPDQLRAAVQKAWRCVADYFALLNVRIYGCAVFRTICEKAWGLRTTGNVLEEDFGRQDASWRHTVREQVQALPSWTDLHGNTWNRRAVQRVVFGWFDVANANGDAERRLGGSFPTGEAHRLWIREDCSLQAWEPDAAYLTRYNNHVCNEWTCVWFGAVQYAGGTFAGARQHAALVMPPLSWYYRLLYAPVPGLRRNSTANELFHGDVTPGDLSFVEWLLALGPVETIRRCRADVKLANSAVEGHVRAPQQTLYGQAEVDLAQRISDQQTRSQAFGSIGGSIGQAVVQASKNELTAGIGVVLGLGSIVGGIIAGLGNAHAAENQWPRDVFGRLINKNELGAGAPNALEQFRVNDGLSTGALAVFNRVDRDGRGANHPLQPLATVLEAHPEVRSALERTTWFGTDAVALRAAGTPGQNASVRITGIPSGVVLVLDGITQTITGGVWQATVPAGAHNLRVLEPGFGPADVSFPVVAGQTAEMAWVSPQGRSVAVPGASAVLRVTGIPAGVRVGVDGRELAVVGGVAQATLEPGAHVGGISVNGGPLAVLPFNLAPGQTLEVPYVASSTATRSTADPTATRSTADPTAAGSSSVLPWLALAAALAGGGWYALRRAPRARGR